MSQNNRQVHMTRNISEDCRIIQQLACTILKENIQHQQRELAGIELCAAVRVFLLAIISRASLESKLSQLVKL